MCNPQKMRDIFILMVYNKDERVTTYINIAYLICSLQKTDFLAYTVLTTINRQGGDC